MKPLEDGRFFRHGSHIGYFLYGPWDGLSQAPLIVQRGHWFASRLSGIKKCTGSRVPTSGDVVQVHHFIISPREGPGYVGKKQGSVWYLL
jgi:hypothetical protein